MNDTKSDNWRDIIKQNYQKSVVSKIHLLNKQQYKIRIIVNVASRNFHKQVG